MKQVFVTGATGFVGRHFHDLMETKPDWQMVAAGHELDLRDGASVSRGVDALEQVPDAVLHLAAQSNVPAAFADPQATFDVNFFGTLRLLQALKARGFAGRFLFVGTADAYGLVPEAELPISEDRPLRPRNPYAVSKAAAEALVYQWTQTEGLDAVLLRPFNHLGPGQDTRFAVPAFARQIAEIKRGRRSARIEVGDLAITRDFTDVRDTVIAYHALLQRSETGSVYNVGSGEETRLDEVLRKLLAIAGVDAEIVVDQEKLRPAEQRRVRADVSRLRATTGWQPRIPLDQTLTDIFNYWMRQP